MRKLIICADDYAQSPAINAAILALIEDGVLTATSCMTLSPYWPQAARLLTSDIRAKADIGLHLDLTQFSSTLRFSHPQLILRSQLSLLGFGMLDFAAVRASIAQQLQAFEQAMGTPPDYVDGHLHVHQLPVIRTALLAELQQRYAHLPRSQRPWLRLSSPPAGSGLKARIIHWLGASALRRQAQSAGFTYSPCLLGVYDFAGDVAVYQAHWQRWATQLAQVQTETATLPPVLMCHPAMPDLPAGVSQDRADPIAAARQVEWHCMHGAAFRQWLPQAQIAPVKGSTCIS